MPELTIVHDRAVPIVRASPHPPEQFWHDDEGFVYARCFTVDKRAWTIVPEVAGFCFDPETDEVVAIGFPSVNAKTIEEVFGRVVLPLVLQFAGREVLHASGILTPAGVVACCGRSGTGKSTMAYGLSRLGYPLWADDAVALEVSGSSIRSLPLRCTPRLKGTAASHFDGRGTTVGRRNVGPAAIKGESAPLAAIYILKRLEPAIEEPLVRVRHLSSSQALSAMLDNAFCFNLCDRPRKRLMLEQYLRIAVEVPVLEIGFQGGFDLFPNVLDQLIAAMKIPPPLCLVEDAVV